MREIRFRARALSDGKWRTLTLNNSMLDTLKIESYYDEEEFLDMNTLGQSTGIGDVSGQEIFEGDILYDEFRNETVSVWWDDCHLAFECRGGEVSPTNVPTVAQCAEIIGNIFDNPELINLED